MAKSTVKLLFFIAPFPSSFRLRNLNTTAVARTLTCSCSFTTSASKRYDKNRKHKDAKLVVVSEKKRTRSPKELHEDTAQLYADGTAAHIPVMLGEVLDVFSSFSSSSKPLRSFVDCTVGAAGHSAAVSRSLLTIQLFFTI